MKEFIVSLFYLTYMFLKYSIPGLLIGMFIAETLVALNVITKLSFIGTIFTKIANLPEECGLALTLAFIDPRAANVMLIDFYKNNQISKKELYISSLMDSFPAILKHWDSLVPTLFATMGMLGIVYFFILVLIGLITTVIFAIIGKLTIKKDINDDKNKNKDDNNINDIKNNNVEKNISIKEINNYKNLFKTVIYKTIKISLPIIKTIFIASFITSFLIKIGIFDYITEYIKTHISFLPFSTEELTISITAMINSIAAYTMAGSLVDSHAINNIQAIRALLFGSVLSSITIIRYFIPYYVGLYGVKDGISLMTISTLTRVVISIFFIAIISVL
ncbi:hypothetical protein [Methanothermococcus okinawensis]|uniref:Nucleoside recognition domain protein n=1 Tax=Methanothermococcus okinawensis (strain DSM 14208 / JCM 11175 / IH1) TaxID=647113 RepID=F8AK79_METOI|nr:hypothetical protein [Methanothermococcus okinawensis]AEH07450.1 nucleoside recognition domain protein [Methanothermococcus okinawensis IH1]